MVVDTEERGNEDVVEQPDVAFIKLGAQKIQGISSRYPREERDMAKLTRMSFGWPWRLD